MPHTLARAFAAAAVVTVLASPAAAQVKDYRNIKYPVLKEFAIPRPEIVTLGNGMTVFLLEDHELGLVKVTARVRTGSVYETADKAGLADLTATVQRTGGTEKMTGDQIDDYLATRAARIETGMDDDSGFASLDCLRDDFDAVFRVFGDILRAPAFAQDKLDVAKVQSNTAIARRNDNVGSITARETTRLVYGPDSPWARMEEYATIAAITRDDLVAWHRKYYQPSNVSLGIVGDFDSTAMKKKVEDLFGTWPKGAAFNEPTPPQRTQPNPGVFTIEKTDVTQANIALAHLGISTKETIQAEKGVPDYFSVQVLNEALGGGFASRLFSNVRSKKGLAYNVYGGVGSAFTHTGIFRVGLQTKSSTMSEAVLALREEIRGIIENPPDAAELKKAKESILNSFIFNYDSKEKVLRQQMTYAYYGLPADFLEQYRTNIEKVTKEDVARVAAKYIHPDRLSLLVVGKSADFDKPVDSFGKVAKLDITIPAPPDTTPKVVKTAAGLEAGKKILARAVSLLGGKDPERVNAVRSSGTAQISMGGQSMSVNRNILYVFPDKMRVEQKTPMGEVTQVISGTEGFMLRGGQSMPLSTEQLQEQRKQMGRDLRFLVRYASDPALEAVSAGEETVEGAPCDVVAVTFRGVESRLWVDSSGKVLKQAYQGTHPVTRSPGQAEAFYSDYRDHDGRQVPHKQVVRFDGQEAITLTLDSFEVNPEVDVAQFEKPAS